MKPSGTLRLARARWAVSAAVAGCSGVPQLEKPGAAHAGVAQWLGAPIAVYALPGGERLQYSRQPFGTPVHNPES